MRRLLEILFWFLLAGCTHAKPAFVPNLSSLMDPVGYCQKRCVERSMFPVGHVVYHGEQVLCICGEEPAR